MATGCGAGGAAGAFWAAAVPEIVDTKAIQRTGLDLLICSFSRYFGAAEEK